MHILNSRRRFLQTAAAAAITGPISACLQACATPKSVTNSKLFFNISLAEWSLHRALRSGKMTNLDFPLIAKRDYGIDAVEYVNQFFIDKAKDQSYLKELKMRCDDQGVRSVLIMCDAEGEMGDPNPEKRRKAVENHYKWVEAAKSLGCHGIRVNALGEGSASEVARAAADALQQLCTFAQPYGIGIMVENHGGYSGQDGWLAGVMRSVGLKNCGTLPDFGNFCVRYQGAPWETPCVEWSDRYQVTAQMMPYAQGVSAKSFDFDAQGNCTETDYRKMLKIVKDAGYRGHIGIEYEGNTLSEPDGIRATLSLLRRVGSELTPP